MSKVKVMLAQTYIPEKHNVKGWYISEKYDGYRGLWNSVDKKMYSRNSKEFLIPDYFIDKLKDMPDLDGELWVGRQKFDLMGTVRKKVVNYEEWKNIKYIVFDAPTLPGTFKDRYITLQFLIKELNKDSEDNIIQLINMKECEDPSTLYLTLMEYDKLGAEGIMLKDPNSLYENKRSSKLLKIKTFMDSEAEVIGHEQGLGKYSNTVGALICKNSDGIEFNVGTGLTDIERNNAPPVGSTITYKYYGFTSKKEGSKPRHPVFLRIREEE